MRLLALETFGRRSVGAAVIAALPKRAGERLLYAAFGNSAIYVNATDPKL
jgi:hypothetical protein